MTFVLRFPPLIARRLVRASAVLALSFAFGPVSCGQSTLDPAKDAKVRIERAGLKSPQSVVYDSQGQVYLVSSLNGSPFGEDKAGFISRIKIDGGVEKLKWIDGKADGVELDAPKGMAIVGRTLYVTDVTVVRKFDTQTGQALGTIQFEGATYLNDIGATREGLLFVSDMGVGKDGKPSGSDAIFVVYPGDGVLTVLKDRSLHQPGAILAEDRTVLVASWTKGELSRVGLDGKIQPIAKLPRAKLGGIAQDKNGCYLISSWDGSCVYSVDPVSGKGGKAKVVQRVARLKTPVDLAYDKQRRRFLVPLGEQDSVLVFGD